MTAKDDEVQEENLRRLRTCFTLQLDHPPYLTQANFASRHSHS